MANVHLHISSFNAGELSPLIGSRFGVEKVASGCRRLRNFIPHVHGPVFRRPGMEYMGAAAGAGLKSRLIDFNFSTTTGAILEFHPLGLRVWSNGLLVPLRAEVPLPYSDVECAELQLAQINDVCYIVHPAHPPQKLIRYADDDWRISELAWKFPPLGDENVRDAKIASPTVTQHLIVETLQWPDWLVPAGDIAFTVISPDLSAASKTVKLQRRQDDGSWLTHHHFTWTTVAPGINNDTYGHEQRVRLTYDGPVAAAGSKARIVWTGGAGGTGDLLLDIGQPMEERSALMPAGDWQAKVSSTNDIPNGAKLHVEQRDGITGPWTHIASLSLRANQTSQYRGNLEAAKWMHFRWEAPRAMMGGSARLDSLVFPETTEITIEVSDIDGNDRTMTASKAIFEPGHVGSFWQITHRRDKPWVKIVAGVPTIDADESAALRVSGRWQVLTYGSWATTLYLEKSIAGNWEVLRSWNSKNDRNVAADGEEDDDALLRLRVDAGTSEAVSEAAVPRFVLEAFDSAINGLVQITAVGALDDEGKSTTATVNVIRTLNSILPTAIWTEGAWSTARGWPRVIALHAGRLWFGGTPREPTRLWGSVVNDYENFKRSSLDDGSVSFTPAATSANALQWMVSHEKELILGTSGDEWTLGAESGPITPTNILVQRRSGYGSARVQAVTLNEAVVFVQRGGRKLRQISPRSDSIAWSATDLTVLAEHVSREGVSSLAIMTNPFTILWSVCGGKLLGMTFEAEQNVFGWHVHETDGEVESVAVIHGVNCDEVWLCILRGAARSIERLDLEVFLRDFSTPERLIYLDSARRMEFPTGTLVPTGLDHLEGRDVGILADGAEHPPRRVVNGRITLERRTGVLIVGLPFVSELQPSRVEVPLRDGTSQGRKFKLSRAVVTVNESLGGEIADAPDTRAQELNYRIVANPMDAPPPLKSGSIATVIESGARDGLDVIIRQRSPLPLGVVAIAVDLDVFGP